MDDLAMSRHAGDGGSTSVGLLQRVAARDPQAWVELVNRYGPLVYSMARQKGVAPEDAIDVVQEVFIGYANRAETFDHVSFRGWLRTCVSHKAVDHFRRLSRQVSATGGSEFLSFLDQLPDRTPVELDGDAAGQAADGSLQGGASSGTRDSAQDMSGLIDDGDSLPFSKEVAAVVEQVRRKTSERCWLVFWRVVMERHDTRDVARDVGMQLGALYECISRTRERLRHKLAALDPSLAGEMDGEPDRAD